MEIVGFTVANIRLSCSATYRQVNSICDSKTDDLRRQYLEYNTFILIMFLKDISRASSEVFWSVSQRVQNILHVGACTYIVFILQMSKKFPKNIGAKDAPLLKNKKTTKEYIYGPKKDLKINADGSTKKDIGAHFGNKV
jgi:hypothetical protein